MLEMKKESEKKFSCKLGGVFRLHTWYFINHIFFIVKIYLLNQEKWFFSKHSPCIIADLHITNIWKIWQSFLKSISISTTFFTDFVFYSKTSFHLLISLQYVHILCLFLRLHPCKESLKKKKKLRSNVSDCPSTPGQGEIPKLHTQIPHVNTTALSLVPFYFQRPYV